MESFVNAAEQPKADSEIVNQLKSEAYYFGNIKSSNSDRYKNLKPNTWNSSLALLVFVDNEGNIFALHTSSKSTELLESDKSLEKDESMVVSDVTREESLT